MQCWFVVTLCCALFFIRVSVPISGWYLATAVPLPVAPWAAPPSGVTVVAPKLLVAVGAPNNEEDCVDCWPKKPEDPVDAVLGAPKIDVLAAGAGVENPPNPVVPGGLAAPKAVVPAWPKRDVFWVLVLAPNTEVFGWD